MDSVFRKDIHFLRAFAVLVVVLFHLKIPLFNHGYLGVDIFFFISGYLISSIINDKLLIEKSITLKEFYIKRVLRIVPSYLFIILVSIISFMFIFSEYHYDKFKESINYSLFFLNNFYFFFNANYFDISSYFKPLLHLWSLSTEFYFYLFFPLFYIILNNYFIQNKILILRSIYIVNLIFLLIFNSNDNLTFYFPLLRCFEFLLGSIVFLSLKEKFNILIDEIFLFIFLFFSVLLFDYDLTLKIVTILVLAIVINKKIIPTFLCRNNLFVFIGNISYSLYLVHWPVIVYFNYLILRDFFIFEKILLFFLSIFISYLLYNFIELKFNNFRKYKIKLTIIFIFIFSILIINFLSKSQKIPNDDVTKQLIKSISEVNVVNKSCNLSINFKNKENDINLSKMEVCLDEKQSILIFGDSHADDIFKALSYNLNNYTVLNFSQPACRLSDNTKVHNKEKCNFEYINNFILNNHKKIDKIIYTQKGSNLFTNKETYPINRKYIKNLKDNLLFIADRIDKDKLLIFGPQKELKVDPYQFIGINLNETINKKYFEEYKDLYNLDDYLESLFGNEDNLIYFSKVKNLQNNSNSEFIIDNKFLYRNKDHWSAFGHRYYGEKIANILFVNYD